MSTSIQGFFAAWSETDDARRHAAIAAAFAETGQYADPRTSAPLTDTSAISDYVGQFIEAAPGAAADVIALDQHHGVSRATIAFRMANGMEQLGQYFVELDNTGRISRMVGFVGTGAPQ